MINGGWMGLVHFFCNFVGGSKLAAPLEWNSFYEEVRRIKEWERKREQLPK